MTAEAKVDERWMLRALKLAAETIGLASPNPQVGCVLTSASGEQVIGEGAHVYENYDHAEIVALKQARERGMSTEGATAYVTLEPCSHHGRTGPCADALIEAGIKRCVIATSDPNPLVSGKGCAKLRETGVEVTLGVCQERARAINDAFAWFIRHHTPFVTLKAALSVDGRLAPPPAARFPNQPYWLTGPAARGEVQILRHTSDAVLTGIGTVLADNPLLTDRSGLARRRPLLRVVLDTHLRTPLGAQLVLTAKSDVLILAGEMASAEKAAALKEVGVEVERVPDHAGRLSLPAVLATLAVRGILSVLLECGSHLNGSFLRQNLVDKAVLFYAETELGEQAIPFAQGVASPYLFEQSMRRVTRASFGADACVSGYLHDPWAL